LIVFEIADGRKQFWDETGSDWLQHFISRNTKVQNLRQKVGKMRTKVRFSGQFCRHKPNPDPAANPAANLDANSNSDPDPDPVRTKTVKPSKISDRRKASVNKGKVQQTFSPKRLSPQRRDKKSSCQRYQC